MREEIRQISRDNKPLILETYKAGMKHVGRGGELLVKTTSSQDVVFHFRYMRRNQDLIQEVINDLDEKIGADDG